MSRMTDKVLDLEQERNAAWRRLYEAANELNTYLIPSFRYTLFVQLEDALELVHKHFGDALKDEKTVIGVLNE